MMTVVQPPGHNLFNRFTPAFYAFRTQEEIETLGSLTLNEACAGFAYTLPYVYE
jgi:hypothetical protein